MTDDTNAPGQEDDFIDELAIQREKEEQAQRAKLVQELRSFEIDIDANQIENKAAEESMIKGNPLGALEDFSDANRIEIEGLEEAMADEKEPDPVRREGSGPFSELNTKSKVDHSDPWSRFIPGLGRVTVTEEHREIYTEVFFTDEPLELPVTMVIGKGDRQRAVEVVCRSLTNYEREVAAHAVGKFASRHPILKALGNMPSQILNETVFRMDMLMMIKRVGDVKWPALRVLQKEGLDPQDDPAVDELVRLAGTHFRDKHGRHFALPAKALHIFEVLTDILDDGEINGDFTEPADLG